MAIIWLSTVIPSHTARYNGIKPFITVINVIFKLYSSNYSQQCTSFPKKLHIGCLSVILRGAVTKLRCGGAPLGEVSAWFRWLNVWKNLLSLAELTQNYLVPYCEHVTWPIKIIGSSRRGDKGNPFTIVADDIGAYYEVIVHLRQNV